MTIRLHQGDCLDVMRRLPDGCVDAVITSPPYNKRTSSGDGWKNRVGSMSTRFAGGYSMYPDDRTPEGYRAWQSEILRECWRVVSDTGAIFYNHKPRIQYKLLETALDWNPGLPVRQIIYWNPFGGVNFSPSHYRQAIEWVVLFAKPGFRLNSRSASGCGDYWHLPYDDNKEHPVPFPVSLPTRILETAPIRSVLDPFMGSGSTGVACARLDRDFIGIDIDPSYVAIARRRIKAEQARVQVSA